MDPYNSLYAALQHTRSSGTDADNADSGFLTLTLGDIYMLTVEQVIASHKANIETLFGLTNKAFEGVEKIVELNLTASKAALSEAATHTQSMLSVKDAQELLALQSGLLQPLAEKTAAYSRHLYDIATSTSAEFTKNAETQAAEAQKKFAGLVDSAAKNAPAGSESVVAIMKSSVAAANNALESVQKAVKQATEVAEANFNAVAATATSATKAATAKKR
jgi:phasin family protein